MTAVGEGGSSNVLGKLWKRGANAYREIILTGSRPSGATGDIEEPESTGLTPLLEVD